MASPTDGFPGTIGRTLADSEPHFEESPHPKQGSPNVVFILLDDTGFAQFGCYGSDIDTPNICLLYTSPSPRDRQKSRMPSSA